MATQHRSLRYRVEFDASQVQRQAGNLRRVVERELRQIQVAPGRSGGGGGGFAQSFVSGAAGAFLPLGAAAAGAVTARTALSTVVALDAEATAMRRVELAARTLTGSQERLNQLMRTYGQVTGGATSRTENLAKVSQLSALGFAENAKQLREFATAVRGSSLATGSNQDYIAQQLQLTLANQSFMRLDQLGLSVTEVRARMEELQQTMPGITREAAFQQSVLGALNDKYGGLVTAQEAAASGAELLAARWKDMRAEIALGGSAIDALARRATVLMGGRNLSLLSEQIGGMRGASNPYIPGPAFSGQQQDRLAAAQSLVDRVNEALQRGEPVAESYTRRVEELAAAIIHGGTVSDAHAAQVAALINEWERGLTVFGDMRREAIESAQAAETYADALDEMRAKGVVSLEELGSAAGRLPGDMGAAGWAVDMLRAKIEALPDQKSIDIQLRIGDQIVGSVNDLERSALGAAAGLVRQGLATPGQAMSMFGLAQNQAGYFGANAAAQGLTGAELALAQAEAERKILAPFEAAEEAERQRERAARNAERAWEKAASEAERAWSDAASTFMGRLRNVPGLLGTSAVTQEQLDLAEMGVAQNFADNYLRRLADEVLNGVDYAGVDLSHIAGVAGIDQSLDPKAQLKLIQQRWADMSLFANPDALQFIDRAAVEESLNRQQRSAEGEANLLAMFGLSPEGEWLPGFGDKLFSQMREQITGPAAMAETTTYGATLMQHVFESWEENAAKYNWADAILAAAYADLSAQLEPGAATP